MGSVHPYDASSGTRYRATYRKPDHSQGTKRGFRTKRAAQLFLASVEVSKARGEFIDASAARSTVGALGLEWITPQSHLKPSSLRSVEMAWRVHVEPVWETRTVGSIRHSEVQTWVTGLTANRGPTTVLRAYGVLAGILDTAVKDRRVSVNVARGVDLPRKVRKEHSYLSHDQVAALANASGDRAALVLLLAYTGLRWGRLSGFR